MYYSGAKCGIFGFRKTQNFQNFFYLKGQSNEIFDQKFFSSFELAWATDQWVKIFLIYVFAELFKF